MWQTIKKEDVLIIYRPYGYAIWNKFKKWTY